MRKKLKSMLLLSAALTGGVAFVLPSQAAAQTAPSGETRPYAIPAMGLADALRQFAEASGLQIVYDTKIAAGKTSGAVSGRMTAQDALGQMLAGSGIDFALSGNGSVILTQGAADGVRSLGVVRVEGAGGSGGASAVNGINGSRDIEATEGTGSYTTGAISVGTKAPLSLKETPLSVSVLTQQNIADQNIITLKDALNQINGVTLVQRTPGGNGGSILAGSAPDQAVFYSRGFQIQTIQIDGGAPLHIGSNLALYQPVIDFSQYDSLQLLRGASGLYNGFGDPGGTINLVRKKPLDHDQVILEGQVASFNDYRGVADLTGPLAFDGHLRGRIVATYENKDYYYSVAHTNKALIYGIVEADLTPTTLLSVGVNYANIHAIPNSYGLPRYQTGAATGLPVATCLCFPWSHYDSNTTEFFGRLDQKIGKDWSLTTNVTYNRQVADTKYGSVQGSVNNLTKDNTYEYLSASQPRTRQWAVDTTLKGGFMLFGQHQQILLGGNWQDGQSGGTTGYSDYKLGAVNIFTFNPYDLTNAANVEPVSHAPAAHINALGSTQWGVYGNIRFTPLEGLHIVSGLHYSKYSSVIDTQTVCADSSLFCPVIGNPPTFLGRILVPRSVSYSHESNLSKPDVSVIYDITKTLSVYGTYSSIYQIQGSEIMADGTQLGPVQGRNIEGGLKWQSPDKRINATIAYYSIIQNNLGDVVSTVATVVVPTGYSCCYVASEKNSKGLDIDVTGRLFNGMQLSLGYTYNDNKTDSTKNANGGAGAPFNTVTPKHLVKIFGNYEFQQEGFLKPLSIGAGVNYQSTAYSYGINPTFTIVTDPTTGQVTGTNFGLPNVPFNYEIKAYAIVQARIGYKISEHLQASLNLDNLTNSHSYQTVSSLLSSGNFYVQPRAFTFNMTAKW